MNTILIDFETYSPEPIDNGAMKYTAHPDADIVLYAYKIDDNPTKVVTGAELPNDLLFCLSNKEQDFVIYAHNAGFDFLAWHNICQYKYGWPGFPVTKWRDSMALANRYSLPGSLADAGHVMNVAVQKSKRGTALIKKICVPTPYGTRPKLGVNFTLKDLQDFADYCRQDIDSTYALLQSLPSSCLTDKEQRYWEITQIMNFNGLPIDEQASKVILSYLNDFVEELSQQVPLLTRGQVNKVTEVKKLLTFIQNQGVNMPDMTAATVEKFLKTDLPPVVKELLELRQMLGRSSTAKYIKMQSMLHKGRVHGNLQYWGTHTGRWAGRGLQIHNLPRASVKDPEAIIQKFLNYEPVDDAVQVAKALIRPMICAPPGHKLIVSDYSSIENRLLSWLADDQDELELFRTGGDQYVSMASFLYNAKPEDVTKAQRQMGKIIVLGCGYGMGAKTFAATAEAWGVTLSLAESQVAVDAYRAKYPKVKAMWYKLFNTAIKALRNPNTIFEAHKCKFVYRQDRNKRAWLIITLPTGRNLFYMEPTLEYEGSGIIFKHWGVNPYSKKWSRLAMIPGRLTENIDQATARDVMANGLDTVNRCMPEIELILTVHDEGGGIIRDEDITDSTMDRFNDCLCSIPPGLEGLPLKAEGYIAQRYKKG